MFGIIRPCRHRLSGRLHADWMAHLCGLCLTLRAEHGQLARAVTNYDGLVISALVEAQAPTRAGGRRPAGPCPLRGMRRASVADGQSARLAAAVSLVLGSAKLRDHIDDGDGVFGRRPVAALARRVAGRWATQAGSSGSAIGFDTGVLTAAVDRQAEVELALRPGDPVLRATEPTELATAAAFAHSAVLSGRPTNAEPLAAAGRLFGRTAHLLDAVEDLDADAAAGAWNPLAATGTDLAEARERCDDAVVGVRHALQEVELTDGELVRAMLVTEFEHAVRRTFGDTGHIGGHRPRGDGFDGSGPSSEEDYRRWEDGPSPRGEPGGSEPPGGSGRSRRCGQFCGDCCRCCDCCV